MTLWDRHFSRERHDQRLSLGRWLFVSRRCVYILDMRGRDCNTRVHGYGWSMARFSQAHDVYHYVDAALERADIHRCLRRQILPTSDDGKLWYIASRVGIERRAVSSIGSEPGMWSVLVGLPQKTSKCDIYITKHQYSLDTNGVHQTAVNVSNLKHYSLRHKIHTVIVS